MKHYCDICEINKKYNATKMIQGKVISKSNLLMTKHETQYFWCLVRDKQQKWSKNASEPNEIKIMFWHPFGVEFFDTIITGKVYDFKNLTVKKTCQKYHIHTHQLTASKNTAIKRKQCLHLFKKGILCNENTNQSERKLQISIKHYFQ